MKIFNQIFSLYFVQKRKNIFGYRILSKKESKYFVQKRIKIFCQQRKKFGYRILPKKREIWQQNS
jgi:hypothetical protein